MGHKSGFRVWRFLAWMMFVALVCLGMAAMMLGAYRAGIYVWVVWVVAGLVGVLLALVIAILRSHCHSRFLGAFWGFGAAVLFYQGFYYLMMVEANGWSGWDRIENVPAFIDGFMRGNVPKEGTLLIRPAATLPLNSAEVGINWFMYGFEFTVVLLVCLIAGIETAGHGYCARHGNWMVTERLFFKSGVGVLFRNGLNREAMAMLLKQARISEQSKERCEAVLEFCSDEKRVDTTCPIYLTLIDSGKKVLKRAVLSESEWRLLPGTRGIDEEDDEAILSIPEKDFFGIRDVGEAYRGQILTRGNIFVAFILNYLPMVLLPPAMFLFFYGVAHYEAIKEAGGGPNMTYLKMTAVGTLLSGISVIFFFTYCKRVQGLVMQWFARRAIERRYDAYVHPHDGEALFVKNVPAGRVSVFNFIENAEDIGWIKVDRDKQLLLFEGDRMRWKVPIGCVNAVDCEDVEFKYGQFPHRFKLTYRYLIVAVNMGGARIQGRFLPYAMNRRESREAVDRMGRVLAKMQEAG